MDDTTPRLTKFIAGQEAAVQIAREVGDGSIPLRVDAVNVALSLANTNASACNMITTMGELLANARQAEEYLKGDR